MILLASASPRRKELMGLMGLDFFIKTTQVDETIPNGMSPAQAVAFLSEKKALPFLGQATFVIGADTVVSTQNEILGKPTNAAEAVTMLTRLSGKTHSVFTGVTVMKYDKIHTFTTKTDVKFFPLTEADIADYVATGEPMDKAGAYGIQGKGSLLVEEICGDYFNVVGLPVSRLWRLLKELGIEDSINESL